MSKFKFSLERQLIIEEVPSLETSIHNSEGGDRISEERLAAFDGVQVELEDFQGREKVLHKQ